MFRWTAVFFVFAATHAAAQPIRDDLWVTNGYVFSSTILGNKLYIGGDFDRIGPATGGFMPTNPTNGVKLLPSLGVDGAVNAIVADGSGGFILGGSFSHYQGVARSSLARVDANGTLLDWNPGVNGLIKSMVVAAGRVYIAGEFTSVGGVGRTNAAAINLSDGTILASWAPNPTLPVHYIGYLNGLVYMGGEFFDVAGTQRAHGGSFDGVTGAATQWQPNTDGPIHTMALRYDVINLTTSVYVGGEFTVCGGAFRRNFALLDATVGSPTFSSALNFDPSPDGIVRVIKTFGNTIPTIFVGGDFANISGNSRPHLARYVGTTLSAFNPAPDGSVYEIAFTGSNLLIGGLFQTVDHALRGYAALINNSTGIVQPWDAAAGNLVRAFGVSATTTWIGGDFTTIGAYARSNLAAIDLSTGAATSWNPGASGVVWAIEAIGDKLYIGGQFNSLGGQGHLNIGRVGTDGNADAAWVANTNLPVFAIAGRALAPSGHFIYLGGPFTTVLGQPRNRIACVSDATPAVVQPFNPNAGTQGDVRAIAVDESNIWVGGTFLTLGGQPIAGIGKLDYLGNVQPWDVNTQKPIRGITLTPTTLYVGYDGANIIGGASRVGLAELNKATPTATAWNPGVDPAAVVFTFKRTGNTVYVGGLIHQLGGEPREMLGAVDAVTGAALPFGPAPSSWLTDPNPPTYYQLPAVIDMELAGGQLLAVGQFTNAGGKPHSGVVGVFESAVSVPEAPVTSTIALRAFPNPALGDQTFSFALPSAKDARLSLFDASGRLMRSMSAGGVTHVTWDGRAFDGRAVAPGLYFARLESGSTVSRTKILRVDR